MVLNRLFARFYILLGNFGHLKVLYDSVRVPNSAIYSFQKKPEKPKWTEEQLEAAMKIQQAYRKYRQRKIEEEARKKKEEMDRLMEEVSARAKA